MIHFDKNTLEEWHNKGITDIICDVERGGCEGWKLHISVGSTTGKIIVPIYGSKIQCHIPEEHTTLLEEAYITRTRDTWILSSKDILSHCGCGKSFQKKSGNPMKDKINLLKSKLQKKEHSHHH